jgi:hypothetical protein
MQEKDLSELSDKEIKKHSSENPTKVLVSEDGRFVFNDRFLNLKKS